MPTSGSEKVPGMDEVEVRLSLTADEQAALRHEFSEPYGHDIRIGILGKLHAALQRWADEIRREAAEHPGGDGSRATVLKAHADAYDSAAEYLRLTVSQERGEDGVAVRLTRDDGERLGSIATQLEACFEPGLLSSDHFERDVRYLRNLSRAALEEQSP